MSIYHSFFFFAAQNQNRLMTSTIIADGEAEVVEEVEVSDQPGTSFTDGEIEELPECSNCAVMEDGGEDTILKTLYISQNNTMSSID